MEIDWGPLENAWVDAIGAELEALLADHPSETFYAGAFWCLYGDYSKLLPPAFSASSEAASQGVRWDPPDWRWQIRHPARELTPLYAPLDPLDVDDPTFERLWEEHIDMLARASRRLTARLRAAAPSRLSPHFFVGIIDFGQGEEAFDYLRRSVDAPTLAASGLLESLSR